MPTTPRFSLPFPVAQDPADVPFYIQDLAEATDAAIPTVNIPVPLIVAMTHSLVTVPSVSATFGHTLGRVPGGVFCQVISSPFMAYQFISATASTFTVVCFNTLGQPGTFTIAGNALLL